MRRFKTNKRRSKKLFSRSARKVHSRNSATARRGGYRI